MSKEIHWNQAQENSKQEKIKQSLKEKEREETIEAAASELYDRMGNPNFRFSDFEDVCSNYDLDEDELLFRMI